MSGISLPAERSTSTAEPLAEADVLAEELQMIVYTISQLNHRIDERFPESGLGRVCTSLLEVGEQTKDRLDAIERPVWWLRVATWLMAALVIGGTIAAVRAGVPGVPIVVGGQAVRNRDVADLVGADHWAADGPQTAQVLARLSSSRRPARAGSEESR